MDMRVEVRPAREEDRGAILALVRSERMRPTGLDWRRFHVACEDGEVVGAVQVRPEGPELASLVVRKDRRGRGLGRALVESRLAEMPGPVFLVAPRVLAGFYERHGFALRRPLDAPRPVAVDWALGQGLGTLNSLARGMRPRRMVVMARG
jgi:N-acetylglutamate synthase-like GNAT family acetyltransferase